MEVHRVGSRTDLWAPCPTLPQRNPWIPNGFDIVVEDLNKVPVFMPFWTKTPVVLLVHHLFGNTAFQEASIPVAAATWLLERPIPRVFGGSPPWRCQRARRTDLQGSRMSEQDIAVVPNGVDLERFTPAQGSGRVR